MPAPYCGSNTSLPVLVIAAIVAGVALEGDVRPLRYDRLKGISL